MKNGLRGALIHSISQKKPPKNPSPDDVLFYEDELWEMYDPMFWEHDTYKVQSGYLC